MSPKFPLVFLIIIILALSILLQGATALANGEEEEEGSGDRGEREGEGGEFAKSLGEFTWSVGPIFILAFVAYKHLLPYLARYKVNLPIRFRHVLDIHIYTSIALGLTALAHGYLLLNYARPLEYIIGLIIVLTIITGVVLRWSKDRRVKLFARTIHAQRMLALLLLILVAIHAATIED